MVVARVGALGATRICPHCKQVVLQSANICPGCQHHLRFNSSANAEPQQESVPAMRIEGSIRHTERDPCEYVVVISIVNERGEKVARQVVGVGALQPGEKHTVTFSVDMMPVRPAAPRRN